MDDGLQPADRDVAPLDAAQVAALDADDARQLAQASVAYGRRARALQISVGAWAERNAPPGDGPEARVWAEDAADALGIPVQALRRWRDAAVRWSADGSTPAVTLVRIPRGAEGPKGRSTR